MSTSTRMSDGLLTSTSTYTREILVDLFRRELNLSKVSVSDERLLLGMRRGAISNKEVSWLVQPRVRRLRDLLLGCGWLRDVVDAVSGGKLNTSPDGYIQGLLHHGFSGAYNERTGEFPKSVSEAEANVCDCLNNAVNIVDAMEEARKQGRKFKKNWRAGLRTVLHIGVKHQCGWKFCSNIWDINKVRRSSYTEKNEVLDCVRKHKIPHTELPHWEVPNRVAMFRSDSNCWVHTYLPRCEDKYTTQWNLHEGCELMETLSVKFFDQRVLPEALILTREGDSSWTIMADLPGGNRRKTSSSFLTWRDTAKTIRKELQPYELVVPFDRCHVSVDRPATNGFTVVLDRQDDAAIGRYGWQFRDWHPGYWNGFLSWEERIHELKMYWIPGIEESAELYD